MDKKIIVVFGGERHRILGQWTKQRGKFKKNLHICCSQITTLNYDA